MSSRTRLAAAVAGVVVGGLVLSGCAAGSSPSSESSDASTDSVESLSMLVVPGPDSAIAYVAKQEGFFEKHGLDVDVTVGQGGAAIAAALQSGGADIGILNYVSLFSGAANGLPLSIVAPDSLGGRVDPGLYVMKNSGISDVADLKGKNVGVISTGSISDLLTNVQLEAAGLSASDVTYVSVPVPTAVAALTGGQVDAMFLDQPSSLQATNEGAVRLFSGFSGEAADLPIGGYIASNTWIADHSGTIKKFRAAIAEAVAANKADPKLAASVVPTYTAITAEQMPDIVMPTFADSLDIDALQRVPDLMQKYGLLDKKIDASSIVAK